MVEKIAFTKEEIESRVKVPAIVEVELKHLIEERLKQSGLYYRIFSRIKTSESLARKYQVKSYNADKKIQDLVGLRVDVYFEDDLRICRRMMEHSFHLKVCLVRISLQVVSTSMGHRHRPPGRHGG